MCSLAQTKNKAQLLEAEDEFLHLLCVENFTDWDVAASALCNIVEESNETRNVRGKRLKLSSGNFHTIAWPTIFNLLLCAISEGGMINEWVPLCLATASALFWVTGSPESIKRSFDFIHIKQLQCLLAAGIKEKRTVHQLTPTRSLTKTCRFMDMAISRVRGRLKAPACGTVDLPSHRATPQLLAILITRQLLYHSSMKASMELWRGNKLCGRMVQELIAALASWATQRNSDNLWVCSHITSILTQASAVIGSTRQIFIKTCAQAFSSSSPPAAESILTSISTVCTDPSVSSLQLQIVQQVLNLCVNLTDGCPEMSIIFGSGLTLPVLASLLQQVLTLHYEQKVLTKPSIIISSLCLLINIIECNPEVAHSLATLELPNKSSTRNSASSHESVKLHSCAGRDKTPMSAHSSRQPSGNVDLSSMDVLDQNSGRYQCESVAAQPSKNWKLLDKNLNSLTKLRSKKLYNGEEKENCRSRANFHSLQTNSESPSSRPNKASNTFLEVLCHHMISQNVHQNETRHESLDGNCEHVDCSFNGRQLMGLLAGFMLMHLSGKEAHQISKLCVGEIKCTVIEALSSLDAKTGPALQLWEWAEQLT